MPSNIDIFRSAEEMIRDHGNNAEKEARYKADSFMIDRDMVASSTWWLIVEAICQIQGKKPA